MSGSWISPLGEEEAAVSGIQGIYGGTVIDKGVYPDSYSTFQDENGAYYAGVKGNILYFRESKSPKFKWEDSVMLSTKVNNSSNPKIVVGGRAQLLYGKRKVI